MNEVLKQIEKIGIVPVVVLNDTKDAEPLAKALCDGKQSIKPDKFDEIMKVVKRYAEVEQKEITL